MAADYYWYRPMYPGQRSARGSSSEILANPASQERLLQSVDPAYGARSLQKTAIVESTKTLCTTPVGHMRQLNFPDGETPPYAILSHTWEEEEVTYADLKDFHTNAYGFPYIWIDTCCIDKSSKADLTEIVSAINSMYQWYGEASICYAYLADIVFKKDIGNSRWFTRGWTLQELIAPQHIIFLNKYWEPIRTKESLQSELSARTKIPVYIHSGFVHMENISVAQRMAWAAGRQTTKVEDRAYSLLGLFGVSMPLLYGEGHTAFLRLQEEIIKVSDDESIFAWKSAKEKNHSGPLATSPDDFSDSYDIIMRHERYPMSHKAPWTVNNKGLQLELRFLATGDCGAGHAILNCKRMGKEDHSVAIYIVDKFLTPDRFERVECDRLELVDMRRFRPSQYPPRLLTFQHRRLAGMRMSEFSSQSQSIVPSTAPRVRSSLDYEPVDEGSRLDSTLWLLPPSLPWHEEMLVDAVKTGNAERVQDFLACWRMNVNLTDNEGRTLLSYAAQKGNWEITQLLLSQRAIKADQRDDRGQTPLSYAAEAGHINIVWLFLTRGDVNVTSNDASGLTPLSYAARTGNVTLVEILLSQSEIRRHIKDESGSCVAWHEHINPDEPCKSGQTPLCLAAANVHAFIITILIIHGGVDADSSSNGMSAIKIAADHGHTDVVKLLIKMGAHVPPHLSDLIWQNVP
ncbi:ankyrin repeat-containing domain protein [Aspergillus novoparasiticus]|uniref:Ankyrin repeat-containing domain protein n=1 Tax=Aspergillus novoparasiticus TaxID=986946 RepID=A0A5N6EW69_9EURO|nr:ankyrin repeat-containing domain protein [Aspergillus novoparasiticus]